MSRFELLFITVLALGSTSVVAADGSERSQAFWKEYKASQERIRIQAQRNAEPSKQKSDNTEKAKDKLAKD
ncbi:hypothetical protein [Pseudomonas akapageensis]|uniref:hypothetical protein n=1 Tax=Pseudomonas akapageensis TaxID=2609961 RepID=UPI00140D5DE5|nr:hypothetical protein [Pseudomonas akapageensis]